MHDRTKPTRVYGYCRVSSAEQGRSGTSLEGQQGEIETYCRANGFPAPRLFIEVESGSYEKAERRFEQIKLMGAVAAHDLVLVAKQDRWSRDTLHYLQSTREIVARGARFFSLAERFDPSTPEGQFASTMMAAVAEQERQRIKERTVGRRRQLRNEGKSVEGHCPYGYRRENKTLRIFEPEARLIRMAYELCIAGQSLTSVRRELIGNGLRRDKQVIHKYLRDRIYLGEMRDTRGIYHPCHEPIVTPAMYEAARASLKKRVLGGRNCAPYAATDHWLLRGLANCALCGRRIGSAYSPRTHVNPLDGFYMCNGRKDGCALDRMQVVRTDRGVADATWAQLVNIRGELARPAKKAELSELSFTSERAELSAKRRRIVDLAVSGVIAPAEAAARATKVDEAIRELDAIEEAQHAQVEAERRLRNPADRRSMLADMSVLSKCWNRMPTPRRREIVALLADRIELDGVMADMAWRGLPELMGAENQPSSATYRHPQLRDLVKRLRAA